MKPCPSFPGYSATEDGRVYSHRRRLRPHGQRGGSREFIDPTYFRELSGTPTKKGYLNVGIRVKGRSRPVGVHQLVADAFLSPRPTAPGTQVRHLDGNPANNRPFNLAWGSFKENAEDRQRHGRYARGSAHERATLNEEQVRAILEAHAGGESAASLARRFSSTEPTVADIVHRRSWRHVEFRRLP